MIIHQSKFAYFKTEFENISEADFSVSFKIAINYINLIF